MDNLHAGEVRKHEHKSFTMLIRIRRLASAGGLPMAISDHSIQAKPPSDIPGFASAAAIAVNVRVARITGRISTSKLN